MDDMTSPPFDLDHVGPPAWPERLKPVGEGDGTFNKQTFSDWWQSHGAELSHLPADLCEQWIHRHWMHSPFTFLPLDTLEYRRLTWSGEEVLSRAYRAWGGELHPQFDYETFQRRGGEDRHQTARAIDDGTWDFPMVLLSTPNGVIDGGEERPQVRYVIVEGHQRHRYLNALHELGKAPAGPHEVLVISSPVVHRRAGTGTVQTATE